MITPADELQKKEDGKKPAETEEGGNPFSGASVASKGAKDFAVYALGLGFLWCVLGAGWLGFSRALPFQVDANFALFAAFIVVAGAIERIIQPLTAVLGPFKGKATPEANANRTLYAYGIALAIGIIVSSCFGLYFMQTMGVEIGVPDGTTGWKFNSTWEEMLRGLDVFLTALIITGGTKPLHDMITSIEKKKETLKQAAAGETS